MKMNEVRAAGGNNKTLWLNKFLPGLDRVVEMSVSFVCEGFRVKIEDLQTA